MHMACLDRLLHVGPHVNRRTVLVNVAHILLAFAWQNGNGVFIADMKANFCCLHFVFGAGWLFSNSVKHLNCSFAKDEAFLTAYGCFHAWCVRILLLRSCRSGKRCGDWRQAGLPHSLGYFLPFTEAEQSIAESGPRQARDGGLAEAGISRIKSQHFYSVMFSFVVLECMIICSGRHHFVEPQVGSMAGSRFGRFHFRSIAASFWLHGCADALWSLHPDFGLLLVSFA